jgi:DNA-binding transcriptional ArsR family regulator
MKSNEALAFVEQAAMLKPVRLRILHELRAPGSASTVARTLEMPRQKVNYHLRELEKAGLLEEIEQRRAGNCIERIVRAKATHYLVHPELLGNLAGDPETIQDRFSAAYLVALAAQTIRDIAAVQERAEKSGKRIATMSLQAEVRFASAADRHAFANDLADAVARVVAKYHDENAENGRAYRVVVGAYPKGRNR